MAIHGQSEEVIDILKALGISRNARTVDIHIRADDIVTVDVQYIMDKEQIDRLRVELKKYKLQTIE